MTMDFKPPPRGLPRGRAAGDKVSVEFYMDAESLPQLSAVTVVASERKAAAAVGAKAGSKP